MDMELSSKHSSILEALNNLGFFAGCEIHLLAYNFSGIEVIVAYGELHTDDSVFYIIATLPLMDSKTIFCGVFEKNDILEIASVMAYCEYYTSPSKVDEGVFFSKSEHDFLDLGSVNRSLMVLNIKASRLLSFMDNSLVIDGDLYSFRLLTTIDETEEAFLIHNGYMSALDYFEAHSKDITQW